MELSIGKIPDTTPVRITLAIPPELNAQLHEYAALHGRTYGQNEKVETLAPLMLQGFLAKDRAFQKALKAGDAKPPTPAAKEIT